MLTVNFDSYKALLPQVQFSLNIVLNCEGDT